MTWIMNYEIMNNENKYTIILYHNFIQYQLKKKKIQKKTWDLKR